MESITKSLSREAFLAPRALKRETVATAAGPVNVQELTAKERDAFERSCVKPDGKKTKEDMTNLRAKLLTLALRDNNWDRLCQDGDVEAIGGLPASVIQPVFEAAARLSGITPDDVEELVGNSAGEPLGGSPSDSPSGSGSSTSMPSSSPSVAPS
jgi:hypothetical protein